MDHNDRDRKGARNSCKLSVRNVGRRYVYIPHHNVSQSSTLVIGECMIIIFDDKTRYKWSTERGR